MNPWRGLKGLPHNMWALFITTLINRSGTMVLPFLTLYLTQKIGVSPAEAGLVFMIYGLGALVSSPLMGKFADKVGALTVMKLSLFGTGIMFVLYSFADSYYMILIISFFLSAVNEAFRPANLSMITQIVAPPQRRMAFVLNRLAINTGMSIGPVIGGFLIIFDYHFLFYANALTSIAAGIYLLFVNIQGSSKSDEENITNVNSHTRPVFKDRKFIFFLLSIVPVNIVFFQILGTLPLYIVQDLKYSTAALGLLLAVNTVLIIIAEVPLNDSMAKISYTKSLFIGAVLTSIGFGLTAAAFSTIPLIITIVIWTFGEMVFFPVSAAYASEIAPPRRRGEYMGYYQMTFNFAFSFGPWLGTLIYQNFGSMILWIWTFVFGSISAVMMLRAKEAAISS